MNMCVEEAARAAAHRKVTTFLDLLEKANAVIVDSPLLNDWNISPPNGKPNNEVARFSWIDEDGNGTVILTEGGIAEGRWVGNSFFCPDFEGDEVQITLYGNYPIVGTDDSSQRYFALLDTGTVVSIPRATTFEEAAAAEPGNTTWIFSSDCLRKLFESAAQAMTLPVAPVLPQQVGSSQCGETQDELMAFRRDRSASSMGEVMRERLALNQEGAAK